MGMNENNDRTAIWVAALDWERKAYMLELQVGRWGLDDRARITVDLAQKYDAGAIGVEEMVSNEGVLSVLDRLKAERRMRCKMIKIGGRSMESKIMRIESLQPRFSEGLIYFVLPAETAMIAGRSVRKVGIDPELMTMTKDGRAQGGAVEEFVRFPRATHDDIPDALSDIDKLDRRTGVYLFPAPSTHGMPQRPHSPSMVNAKMVWSGEVEESKEDFWKTAAATVRNVRARGGMHG
jgi:phage terminase large subunit-like protein